jgi:tetratricopeptide (TPR) repeat protein
MYGRLLTRRAFLGMIIAKPRETILADLEEGLAIARRFENEAEIALNNLARGTLLMDPPADLKRFEEACQLYKGLQDDFYLTRVYMAIANCHGYLLDPQKFKYYIYEAVNIARTTGNFINLALSVGNLAEVELAFGQYEQAQLYIEEALSMAYKMHGWLLVSFSNCLAGFIRLLGGDFVAAEEGGRKGLAQAEEIDHRYLKAYSLSVLSIWAGLTDRAERGYDWAVESQAIPENNMTGLVLTPWGLAINQIRLGQPEKAGESLANAFKQAEIQKLPAPMIWLMATAALVAVEKGESETAVCFLSIAHNHPFSVSGWMAAWPRLAGLEGELKEGLEKEAFEAAWAAGLAYQDDVLPSEILEKVYGILT